MPADPPVPPVRPRPPRVRELLTRGCLTLGMVGGSQFVAGGALAFVAVMAFVMQSRLTHILAEKEARMTMVAVPTRVMGPGTVIEATDLQMVRIEGTYVPSTAIRRADELVGRTVNERLLPGEYVRPERIAALTPNQGLNAIVPTGARAVSLDLREGEQVGGFVEPGNTVDLLVTLPNDHERTSETVTIVQGVRVLAVDERVSETAKGEEIRIPRVTLAVPLGFAEDVVHALAIGRPKLTLRSEIDLTRQETNGARAFERLGAAGRLSVSEFRAKYSEDDVSLWIQIVYGDPLGRVPVVDPALLRGVDGRTAK